MSTAIREITESGPTITPPAQFKKLFEDKEDRHESSRYSSPRGAWMVLRLGDADDRQHDVAVGPNAQSAYYPQSRNVQSAMTGCFSGIMCAIEVAQAATVALLAGTV